MDTCAYAANVETKWLKHDSKRVLGGVNPVLGGASTRLPKCNRMTSAFSATSNSILDLFVHNLLISQDQIVKSATVVISKSRACIFASQGIRR